jgi:hypothetical protein
MSPLARRCLAVAVLLAAPLLTGCPSVYPSETVLHADGSIERAIYQEAKETPTEAKNPGLWKQTTFATTPDNLEKQGLLGPISHLPIRGNAKDLPYFAAWGDFKSIKDLPEHVVFKAPEGSGLPNGKLARSYTRNDYVFVVEHRWRETLTDIVTLAGMCRARGELADLLIGVVSDTLDEALGNEYDTTALTQALRGEGKEWFAELTDFLFMHCATHKRPAPDLELYNGLADICARHGLVLKRDGVFLEGEAAGKVVDDFVIDRICRYVRHKASGKLVDRKEVTVSTRGDKQGQPTAWDRAWDRVIAKKYGGKQAFERRVATLIARVFGLQAADGVLPIHQFDYTLTVPGEVLETNGQILASNRVRWTFDAFEAYPFGYDMVCRSLDVQPQAQKELLHGQPLKDRDVQARFADVADTLPGVAEALQACRKERRMKPLYDYRQKVARDPRTPDKPVNDLLRLLGLPEQPPKE